MKQISVRLEDKLASAFKVEVAKRGITAQEALTNMITTWLGNDAPEHKAVETKEPVAASVTTTEVKTTVTNTIKDPSVHYIPKTHKVGKPVTQMRQFQEGDVTWMLVDGCRPHYDEFDKVIPFRFTDEKGKVWEPDEDELHELSSYYGKPVQLEN